MMKDRPDFSIPYTSLDIKSKNQTNNQYTYPLDFKFCPPYKDKAITLTNSDIRMKVYPQPGDTFFNIDQEGSKAVFDPTINTDWADAPISTTFDYGSLEIELMGFSFTFDLMVDSKTYSVTYLIMA